MLRIGLPVAPVLVLGSLFGSCDPGAGASERPLVSSSPAPPEIGAIAGIDPEVRRLVDAARARVLANPTDVDAREALAMVLDANELEAAAEVAWVQRIEVGAGAGEASAASSARAWYALSRVRERLGDPVGSLAALEAAVALVPDYPPTLARLGRLLVEEGRIEEAERALARVAELEPDGPRAALGLARIELSRDRPKEAIRLLEPLVARNPREAFAHGLLARAYARVGDTERAAEHRRADGEPGVSSADDPWAAEIKRHAAGMLVRIERAKESLRRGDPEAALAVLEPLEQRLDELPAVEALCEVYLTLGRPDDALALLDASAERFGEAYRLVLFRARAERALGDADAALLAANRAVERNPERADGHALAGAILFDLARFDEAADALAAATERGDDSLGTAMTYGRALANRGELDAGIAVLEAAARAYERAPKPLAYGAELLALAGRMEDARAALAGAEERGLDASLVDVVAARLDDIEAANDEAANDANDTGDTGDAEQD